MKKEKVRFWECERCGQPWFIEVALDYCGMCGGEFVQAELKLKLKRQAYNRSNESQNKLTLRLRENFSKMTLMERNIRFN